MAHFFYYYFSLPLSLLHLSPAVIYHGSGEGGSRARSAYASRNSAAAAAPHCNKPESPIAGGGLDEKGDAVIIFR